MVVVADNVPVIVTLPGIVTAPLESIVRRATPPVTKDNSSFAGLINPVFVSPANFKAQLFRSPDFENNEFEPSCLNNGNPPLVIASCITTVFNEVSTVTSPSAPLKPVCSAVVPLLN